MNKPFTHDEAVNLLDGLEDGDTNRGIAISLRTYLSMLPPGKQPQRQHIEDIAYARDEGTKAFIEVQNIK